MAVKKATSAARRSVPAKTSVPAKASAKAPASTAVQAPVKVARRAPASTAAKATAKTTTRASVTRVTATGVPSAISSAPPQRLRVRESEKPWTAKELAAVRAALEVDVLRLQEEISVAEDDLAGLMRDAGDGAGDDQADAGTATFEREQEISLANNAREMLEQSGRALARIVDGSYGVCESCGSPIGKNRLLAFPRATLCLTCKSKQERR